MKQQEEQFPKFVGFTPCLPVREIPDRYPKFVQTTYFYDRLGQDQGMQNLIEPESLPPQVVDPRFENTARCYERMLLLLLHESRIPNGALSEDPEVAEAETNFRSCIPQLLNIEL